MRIPYSAARAFECWFARRADPPELPAGTRGELPLVMNTSTHKAIKHRKREAAVHNPNSVEGLRGHPIGERVLARQAELEEEMMKTEEGSAEYIAIDTALATLEQYLSADLDHLSQGTAHDLNNWLERNKYLGMSAETRARRAH